MEFTFGQEVRIEYRGYEGPAFVVTVNPSVVEVAYAVPSETRPGCFNHGIYRVGTKDAARLIKPVEAITCAHCKFREVRHEGDYCSDACEAAATRARDLAHVEAEKARRDGEVSV